MVRAPIHLELERGAVAALSAGDHRLAFQLADRRCRMPPRASPHCFVLRAESLRGMGCHADALIDLATALELDPTDISANRRMLRWGSGPARIEAAKALVAHDRDFAILRLCLETLRETGRTNLASVTVYDGRIEGWAVWTDDGAIAVSMSAGADARRTSVPADPFHPLASAGVAAASFAVERPKSRLPQQIEILLNSEVLQAQTAPPNAPRSTSQPLRSRLRAPMSEPAGPGVVTIVVPVYADPAATGACLDSLFGQLPTPSIGRIILVDDASPDPRIKTLLKAASRQPSVVVIENPKNLGFVGSINRALSMIQTGDVILLNADTVVPPGFAARLAYAAQSAADIGTVTPLSNNGECTSFPVLNRAAPLPDMATLLRLDRAAALANRDVVVDMPNGIGFCLYIRRDCLDAVGPLAEVYHRGYFEDVDICLLARERGFRNVCAASVFVGHAGSRSFQKDKRALVLRNLKVLEQRYPDHDRETAAFEAADPLRPARAAIERIVPPTARAARLIVTGSGPVAAVARERARALSANGEAVLIARLERGCEVAIAGTGDDIPQSLRFALDTAADRKAFASWLALAEPARIEWAAPAAVPPLLIDLLVADGRPYDILVADAGLVCPRGVRYSPTMLQARQRRPRGGAAADVAGTPGHRARWLELAAGADAILLPSPAADTFAARAVPTAIGTRRVRLFSRSRPQPAATAGPRLGLLPLGATLADRTLLDALAARLCADSPGVVMLGSSPDAGGRRSSPSVAATGRLAAADVPAVLDRYAIGAVVALSSAPLFGHPIEAALLATGCRHAGFDWSGEASPAQRRDLSLDPLADPAALGARIRQWWLS